MAPLMSTEISGGTALAEAATPNAMPKGTTNTAIGAISTAPLQTPRAVKRGRTAKSVSGSTELLGLTFMIVTIPSGYNPKEYFNLSNSYGDLAQHLSMLTSLLGNGVEPIADVVINHRDGSHRWADFRNPDWGTWAITRNHEAFTNSNSDVYNTPEDERGVAEEQSVEYAQHGGTTYG